MPEMRIKESPQEHNCSYCGNHTSNTVFTMSSYICVSHINQVRRDIEGIGLRYNEEKCDSETHKNKIINTAQNENDSSYIWAIDEITETKDCFVCDNDIDNELGFNIKKIESSGHEVYNSTMLLSCHLKCLFTIRKALIELDRNSYKVISRKL
jgi:hypothetical protein